MTTSKDEQVLELHRRLHRAGIEVDIKKLIAVVKFINDPEADIEVLEAKKEFYKELEKELERFLAKATTEKSKAEVIGRWNVIVELYNKAHEYEVLDPNNSDTTSTEPAPRKFQWLWIGAVIFLFFLGFTLGSKVFPDAKVATSKAIAELEQKYADQSTQMDDLKAELAKEQARPNGCSDEELIQAGKSAVMKFMERLPIKAAGKKPAYVVPIQIEAPKPQQ